MEMFDNIITRLQGLDSDEIMQGIVVLVAGYLAFALTKLSARLGLRAAKNVHARLTPKPGLLCKEILSEIEFSAAQWTPRGPVREVNLLKVGRLAVYLYDSGNIVDINVEEAADWCVWDDILPHEKKLVARAVAIAVKRAQANEAIAHHERSLRLLTSKPAIDGDESTFDPTEGDWNTVASSASPVTTPTSGIDVEPTLNESRARRGLPPIKNPADRSHTPLAPPAKKMHPLEELARRAKSV